MGHIGLLPQSIKGNFIFKGKSKTERNKILNDAKVLSSSGVFSIVLECVEKSLAKMITQLSKSANNRNRSLCSLRWTSFGH